MTDDTHLSISPGPSVARCLADLMAPRSAPLPYSLRIVLENLLRNAATPAEQALAREIAAWRPGADTLVVPLAVDRVVLPDSSGLPVLMDFAALRDALLREGGDPARAEPRIPCDLVVDHSLIVDQAGHPGAMRHNLMMEFRRNSERYAVFKWAQQAFSRLRVIPPGMGIIHQVHIEHLARVVTPDGHPEFVLGCDSHTPMVNALGVLGWGVGGIDAEAALVGERYRVVIPRVVGVRLSGALRPGVTTTDLVLTLTERLRQLGVVGAFVEFTGPGLDRLAVPERATLCNMAPEYGATCGYFPIDARTLDYLRQTGRAPEHVAQVERVARELHLFRESTMPEPEFSDRLDLDLATVEPSMAGPRRPQDRLALSRVADAFRAALARSAREGGFEAAEHPGHGRVAIAAITSCTNTSNPALMLGAGLLARNALARGLRTAPGVKTSMAPGSRVALRYLETAGLLAPLEELGFHAVGFGCTTCSGKSGPIDPEIQRQVTEEGMVAAAVLSGNRNFEGRIHKAVQAAYLASPLLVVAYALAGRIDIDPETQPLGQDAGGRPVFLADIWPDEGELARLAAQAVRPEDYRQNYARIAEGTEEWQALATPTGPLFGWDAGSSYICRPPFFDADFLAGRRRLPDRLEGARALAIFGDSLTTDHVTPSGEITADTLAGQYLAQAGVPVSAFNAYTQRRGNHEVMARATFANPRLRNRLVDRTGGWTRHLPGGEEMPIHTAAMRYRAEGTPFVILAGRDYGMGSSRDWAAKGPALLGVAMVMARNFERIHRSNLVGMGIVPAIFTDGESVESLGLTGEESFAVEGLHAAIRDGQPIRVTATAPDGRQTRFALTADLHGADERALLAAGGIFPRLFDRLLFDRLLAAPAS
ncbi:MAG: aconitate hydratase AcnA [Paracoccus sp. (in: a-proteobacteria)]|uniref:aconitate hydratase AcnA n=1 Tax=Paracoccus sp. TaxID=267 RepID=UPI0039E21E75